MEDICRFKVGRFECVIASDGTNQYAHPAEELFPSAGKEDLHRALHRHGIDPAHWDVYVSPYPGIVVFTGERTILVDTGAGTLLPTTGKLVRNLEKEGISPTDIDTVLLTHAHPDHVGGAIHNGKLVFPRATYFLGRREWEFWTGSPDVTSMGAPQEVRKMIVDVARATLSALGERLRLIDGETEIAPGIRTLPAPGHTPGMVVAEVSSGKETLLVASDAFIHPIHIEHHGWSPVYDLDRAAAVESRRMILERVKKTKARMFAFHFPFPGLGSVEGEAGAWLWHPLGIGTEAFVRPAGEARVQTAFGESTQGTDTRGWKSGPSAPRSGRKRIGALAPGATTSRSNNRTTSPP